jgi:two-component system, NtrC family, sensor kinase
MFFNSAKNNHFTPSSYMLVNSFSNLIKNLNFWLSIVAALMVFTDETVLLFHFVFILLSIGAFYWKFRAFIIQTFFWVFIDTGYVFLAVYSGKTQAEELIEIPLLTTILAIIFLIARQKSKAENKAILLNLELDQKLGELTQANKQLSDYNKYIQQVQTQIIQAEKMSGLGLMVGGIAHEINNPVSFIYGNINYAKEHIFNLMKLLQLYQEEYQTPSSRIQDYIEEIDLSYTTEDLSKILVSMKSGAERIHQIVLSLRIFSRLDESQVKMVNLDEGLDSSLVILGHRIKQDITITKQYANLPLIECYPAQLNQVFMNILCNAFDVLETNQNQQNKCIGIETKLVDADWIQIRIWDNGSGIPLEINKKVFDPFFTTKPIGKGTGLGLAISYQIIEKHRGTITLSSVPHQRTEFVITLPVQLTKGRY